MLPRKDGIMDLGERIRAVREEKKLSQGDIEHATGLLRCYISRVENGHTVPSIETLEKIARALDMKVYQLLYDGDNPPNRPELGKEDWGSGRGKEARLLNKFQRILRRVSESDKDLLLFTAEKMIAAKK
jgi:transcriptional regulator with XRE-family HTH domain